MAYFLEPKSETLYVTSTSIIWKRRPGKMIVESRPEYAVVQLSGIDETFPVPWDEISRLLTSDMKRISGWNGKPRLSPGVHSSAEEGLTF